MYRLYVDWMKRENSGEKIVSEKMYRLIFNTKFNLSFHKPKKDQCKLCNVYERSSPREKAMLEENYQKHWRNKTDAKAQKNADKAYANDNKDTVCFAIYDLQKVLQVPKCETSDLFYSRKLNVYDFTIYDAIEYQGYCYVWTEAEAKRGANEIASAVFEFISMMMELRGNKGLKEFIFWSDNCNGQNKNKYLFAMYTLASLKFNVKITHRYLEVGHTGNEADSMHSNIERESRYADIFVPEEWCDVMRRTKTTGKQYIVKQHSKIYDFHVLADKHQKWTYHKNISWKKLREVVVNPNKVAQLQVKENFAENAKNVNVTKTAVGRPANLATFKLTPAYDKPLSLKASKIKDLWKLCNSLVIPSDKHHVYLELENFPPLTNPIILMNQEDENDEADEDDEDPDWIWGDENDSESEVDWDEWLRRVRHENDANNNAQNEDEDQNSILSFNEERSMSSDSDGN